MPVAVPFESIEDMPTTDGETFVTMSGIGIASFGVESCAIVGRLLLSTSEELSSALESDDLPSSFDELLAETLLDFETGLFPVISVYPTTDVVPIAITLSIATTVVSIFLPFDAFGFFGE